MAKQFSEIRNTKVDYLFGEIDQENIKKDPNMHKGLNEIENMDKEDRNQIHYAIDAFKIKCKT